MYVYGSIFDGVMYVLLGDVCSVRTYCLNCYALNDLIPLIIILLYQYINTIRYLVLQIYS